MTDEEKARRLGIIYADCQRIIGSFRADITFIDAIGALGAAIVFVVKRSDATEAERTDLMLDFCTKILNETLTGTAVLCTNEVDTPPTPPTSSSKH